MRVNAYRVLAGRPSFNQWLRRQMLIWEGDIKIDVGEMCCIEEVFQTAVVGHLNLNNILKLGESNCSTHQLELVKFHTGHIS